MTTLAAGAIAKIAFDELIKTGAGELAKNSVEGAIGLVKNLRDKIRTKFQENPNAKKALDEVEQQGSPVALEKLTKYLDIEMIEDKDFANEIRQIAYQIINIQNQNTSTREYKNYGRDQINIENIQGNTTIGGS